MLNNIPQKLPDGTTNPEWLKARMGKVTASRVVDILAKTKSGYSTSRQNYMMELLCHKLTGKVEESWSSPAMQRGTELEPKARAFYELVKEPVTECGLISHPSIPNFAASPDGLVGDSGLIEIKCPNTANHWDFIKTQKPDGKYIIQMQVQMMCTNRAWCDFVSFDDRMPTELQFSCVRIPMDYEHCGEIAQEVIKFNSELEEEYQLALNFIKQRG